MTGPPEFMTVKEVAARLRVTEVTVYRWIGEGKLASTKVGGKRLIASKAVDDMIESGKK